MIMRIRDPKTTALVFASGKMVSPGDLFSLQAVLLYNDLASRSFDATPNKDSCSE